jgi:RND family efflux transporter MFP subunit
MTELDLRSRPVLALAALLLAGCPLGCKRAAPPPEEKVPPAPVKWEGALQSALKEWTELVGTTMPLPDRVARVTAPVEGRVLSVLTGADGKPVVEGQRVDKGTVLVQLDATIIKANLAKLEAAQEVFPAEQKQAQYALDLATLDVNRLRKLKEEDDKRRAGTVGGIPTVSPVDLERAAIALKDAQAKFEVSKSRQAAGAKEVEALKAQLQLYTLAAPISGRIGRIQVVPGQTLAVGTAVAEVVDLDEQIDVLCFVPASMVRKLEVSQQAWSGPTEKDPASTEPEATGEIIYIADQAEPETGNFAVKVRFDNKEAHLRSNRVLRLHVKTHPTKECLSLPEAAVSEDEEVPTVVIVEDIKQEKNADGKEEAVGTARRLQAVLGVRDRKLHQVEILRLEDPDKESKKKWTGEVKDQQFVVEKGQGLQTGDKVKLEVEEE